MRISDWSSDVCSSDLYSEAVTNYLRAVGIEADLQFLQWRALRPLIVDDKTPIAHLTFGSNGMLDASASTGHYFQFSSDDYARDPEVRDWLAAGETERSEEHTSELQSLMRISYAVFCLKKKKKTKHINHNTHS